MAERRQGLQRDNKAADHSSAAGYRREESIGGRFPAIRDP
jgi:hypothetical protein